MTAAPEIELAVSDLGRMSYADAYDIQKRTHARVLEGQSPPTVLLVEHDPVVTISRRKGASDHLLADRASLARLGIDVQPTDRGGDITYHGPGQLVAYPILRLQPFNLNVGRYMRLLEHAVIDTVAAFDVHAQRDPDATGVWVMPGDGSQAKLPRDQPAKLCAMGVRVRRNVTMHGLALNVTTDLTHFDTIVPCGLADRRVTSLEALLGKAAPAMTEIKRQLVADLGRLLTAARDGA